MLSLVYRYIQIWSEKNPHKVDRRRICRTLHGNSLKVELDLFLAFVEMQTFCIQNTSLQIGKEYVCILINSKTIYVTTFLTESDLIELL